ncbi:MAG: serine hydrolase [Planctomycetota bacterium]
MSKGLSHSVAVLVAFTVGAVAACAQPFGSAREAGEAVIAGLNQLAPRASGAGSPAFDPALQIEPAWFAAAFLEAVPPAQLEGTARQLAADGRYEFVRVLDEGDGGSWSAEYAQGDGRLQLSVSIDGDGLIDGLFVRPMPAELASLEDFAERAALLADRFAMGVYRLDDEGEIAEVLIERSGDEHLAIGSLFKVYVLVAAAEAIEAGELAWDTPIELREPWRSSPDDGMFRTPDGESLPLSEVAELMIRISDNTATDHLMYTVGRDKVEDTVRRLHSEPAATLPFLTTREMFRIKLEPDRSVPERFSVAGEAERREMLAADEGKRMALLMIPAWVRPQYIDTIEWFVSPRDAAAVMAEAWRMGERHQEAKQAMTRNPGLRLGDRWTAAYYKGGSEMGVLNLTWLLERDDGEMFVVTVTWNDTKQEIDRSAFGLTQAMLGLVEAAE